MEKQEFLYRLHPTRLEMLTESPTEQETAIVGEHFAYLQRLAREGIVQIAGRTLHNDAYTFGIVLFRAVSEEAAKAIMQEDPAVAQGVMCAELFPFRTAIGTQQENR